MIPILPKGDLEYLKQVFSFSELMRKQHANNDEHIGYMKGVQAVLEVCEALANPPRTEDYTEPESPVYGGDGDAFNKKKGRDALKIKMNSTSTGYNPVNM